MNTFVQRLMVMLTISTLFISGAKAQSNYQVTSKGIDWVVNNPSETLESGVTGNIWLAVLNRFCVNKFGKSFQEVYSASTTGTTSSQMYNTQFKNRGFSPYFDKSVDGDVLIYNGVVWLKKSCAQMLSTDPGQITCAISGKCGNAYAPAPQPAPVPCSDCNTKIENMPTQYIPTCSPCPQPVTTVQCVPQQVVWTPAVVNPCATTTDCGMPWYAWILGLLIVCGLIAFLIIYMKKRRDDLAEARKQQAETHAQALDQQNKTIVQHYEHIGMFETAKNNSNVNAANNAISVHNAWRNTNNQGG